MAQQPGPTVVGGSGVPEMDSGCHGGLSGICVCPPQVSNQVPIWGADGRETAASRLRLRTTWGAGLGGKGSPESSKWADQLQATESGGSKSEHRTRGVGVGLGGGDSTKHGTEANAAGEGAGGHRGLQGPPLLPPPRPPNSLPPLTSRVPWLLGDGARGRGPSCSISQAARLRLRLPIPRGLATHVPPNGGKEGWSEGGHGVSPSLLGTLGGGARGAGRRRGKGKGSGGVPGPYLARRGWQAPSSGHRRCWWPRIRICPGPSPRCSRSAGPLQWGTERVGGWGEGPHTREPH